MHTLDGVKSGGLSGGPVPNPAEIGARSNARGQVYSFLALAFSRPDGRQFAALRREYDLLPNSLHALGDRSSRRAASGLRRSIASLTAAALEDAHVRCFGHAVSKDTPPYEAEYGQAHIFEKTQTLADIAGFYRAFGLEMAAGSHERVDHISVELEFMHFLCLKEAHALENHHPEARIAMCRDAQAKFLREHLSCWAPGFAQRLRARADGTPYQGLSELLASFLAGELRALGVQPARVAGPDVAGQLAPVAHAAADTEWSGCEVACGHGRTL
jgi:putative dimethyl sulfoxide reductase chaperone